jgi:hypothetical protein
MFRCLLFGAVGELGEWFDAVRLCRSSGGIYPRHLYEKLLLEL